MSPERLLGRRFFYGWVVVAATFVLVGVSFGLLFSFGTYVEPLAREFGADRSAVSFVFSLAVVMYTGLGALTGPLTDRFGPRRLIAAAALAILIGLGLAGRAGALWHVYLTYSVFVGFAIAAAQVPSISTVQRWFVRRRGLATSLAYAGVGVGTLLGPALSTWLIAGSGWRTAYLVTGLGGAALTGLAGWLVIRSPAQIGLAPDGRPTPPGPPSLAEDGTDSSLTEPGRSLGAAVGSPEFGWLYLAMIGTSLAFWIVFAHIVPYARDAGLDAATASLGLGALGLGSTFGRLLLGPVADRVGTRRSYALTIAVIAAGMVAWLVLPAGQVWALGLFGFVFGTAYGGFVTLCPVMMAEYFGTRAVSGVLGVFYTGAGLGALGGPWLAGMIYDRTGSYLPGILIGAVTAGLATAIVLRLRDAGEPRPPGAATHRPNDTGQAAGQTAGQTTMR